MNKKELIKRAKEFQKRGIFVYSLLLDDFKGRKFLGELKEYAKKTYPRGNCFLGASKLGMILPWGDKKLRKEWLFEKLEEIHGDSPNLSPWQVNRKHNLVYRRAQALFGSYQKALRAWKPGTYRKTAKSIRPGVYAKGDNKRFLAEGLEAIAEDTGDLSPSALREEHKTIFNAILRETKGNVGAYTKLMKELGFSALSYVFPQEAKLQGKMGEMFSMIYFYALYSKGKVEYFSPYLNVDEKVKIEKKKGDVHPDLVVIYPGDDHYSIVEVKSGYSKFTGGRLYNLSKTGVFNKYIEGEFISNDSSLKNAKLSELHTHFPTKRIRPKVFDMLRRADVRLVNEKEVALILKGFEDVVGGEVSKQYSEFIARPIKLVRSPGHPVNRLLEEKLNMLAKKYDPVPF